MKYKTVWTGTMQAKTYVLDNSAQLRAERFDIENIQELSQCKHIRALELYSNKSEDPIDLGLMAHINDLEELELERVNYINLNALAKMPKLKRLSIRSCQCFNFSDLDGLHNIESFKLSHHKLTSFPDSFSTEQMAALKSLSLSNNKLKVFPENLNIASIERLSIMWNELTDTTFLNHYPWFKNVDLSYNKIKVLSPLIDNLAIEELAITGSNIADISPAKNLKNLKRFNVPEQASKQAKSLGINTVPPFTPFVESEQLVAAKEVIKNFNKEKYHQLSLNDDVKRAISFGVHCNDNEVLQLLLSHPDQEVFNYVIQSGVNEINSKPLKMLEEACLGHKDKLIPALICAYNHYFANLDHWSLVGGEFFNNRFKEIHIKILKLATPIAGPECSELFKLYLTDFKNFSTLHQTAYKQLSPIIKKTKDTSLTPHIIRIIPCEKNILGGEIAYVKKALAAIKCLGNQSHLAELEQTWQNLNETREDVINAYHATVKAIEKRKVK